MDANQIATATECYTTGMTQGAIAKRLGVSRATVNRNLNKDETKAIIEDIQSRIADQAYSRAADNIIHAITKYQSKGIKDDPQLREHGFKASTRILESMGILPSHAPSVYVQQLINQDNTIYLDSASEAALRHLGLIDITPDVNDTQDEGSK